MPLDLLLKDQLPGLLDDGWAHAGPRTILANFPVDALNTRPPNVPYTPFQLLLHINFCQREILDMLVADELPTYTFPDDYWPTVPAMANERHWKDAVDQFFADRDALAEIAKSFDLTEPAKNYRQHTVLYAILNVSAHNHYHLGEFAILRQVMGTWPASHEQP